MERELAIEPNRLFAAADALLEAMLSKEGMNSLVEVRFGQPQDSAATQASMRAFTPAELTEAMSLLIRLGLARPEHRDPNHSHRHRSH